MVPGTDSSYIESLRLDVGPDVLEHVAASLYDHLGVAVGDQVVDRVLGALGVAAHRLASRNLSNLSLMNLDSFLQTTLGLRRLNEAACSSHELMRRTAGCPALERQMRVLLPQHLVCLVRLPGQDVLVLGQPEIRPGVIAEGDVGLLQGVMRVSHRPVVTEPQGQQTAG